jgi:hydrogenase/urease accessory protein HupE
MPHQAFLGWIVYDIVLHLQMLRTMINIGLHPAANHNIISAVWGFLEVFVGSLTTGMCLPH